MLHVAALIVGIGEPREPADLPPIPEATPREEFHHVQPRAIDADADELVELSDLSNRGIIRHAQQRPPLVLQGANARAMRLQRRPFAVETRSEARRHGATHPRAGR